MSARSNILLALSAAVAAGGCGDISNPSRSNFYDWRLVVGIDSLTFHWPEDHTVRVWVQDTLSMPANTQAGIDTWKRQFLYQEFDAVLVPDSATADVLVGVTIPPAAARAIRLGSMAPECTGDTTFPPLVGSTIVLPFHIRVVPRTLDPEGPATQACLRLTVTHELGHAMGLFKHSPDPNDLMAPDPVSGPTARDRNTVQQLYHFEADLTASR